MIHTQLVSVLATTDGPVGRRHRVDKSTFEVATEKYITFSSGLATDTQLRKARFVGSFYFRRSVGTLALTLISAGLAAIIAYAWFFANIRLDYGDVATFSDCHHVPFSEVFPNSGGDSRPFEICDTVTHEVRNYRDLMTDIKNGFRVILGTALTLYALSLLWRAVGRFRVIRKDLRSHRSVYDTDIVRTFDVSGYQWDALREGIYRQFAAYDGSVFTDQDQPWDMVVDALTRGTDLGAELDEPASKYLNGSHALAVDEERNKPFKEERDATMKQLSDKAAIRMWPKLIAEVNRLRRIEDAQKGVPQPDSGILDETNRQREEINAAANIAAAEEVVI